MAKVNRNVAVSLNTLTGLEYAIIHLTSCYALRGPGLFKIKNILRVISLQMIILD